MATERNGTLYVGMTSDLVGRALQHREGTFDGFSRRYKVHRLVYFESTEDVHAAIRREKQIKKWRRLLKLKLIERVNPTWKDLLDEIV